MTARVRAAGAAVVVSSADGVEIEGLCDRVVIFARGAAVKELSGAEVHDAAITEANMNVTTLREQAQPGAASKHRLNDFLRGDYFPPIVLGVLTIVIALVINAINPYFLTSFNISNILAATSLLAFISAAPRLPVRKISDCEKSTRLLSPVVSVALSSMPSSRFHSVSLAFSISSKRTKLSFT